MRRILTFFTCLLLCMSMVGFPKIKPSAIKFKTPSYYEIERAIILGAMRSKLGSFNNPQLSVSQTVNNRLAARAALEQNRKNLQRYDSIMKSHAKTLTTNHINFEELNRNRVYDNLRVYNDLLESFIIYSSINSQSDYDSVTTAGQLEMVTVLYDDVKKMISDSKVKNVKCTLSDEGYLYVAIPSNVKQECPSLGISCHLDVTPEAPGGDIRPIVDTLRNHVIVRTDGSTILGADDKCGCAIAMELIRTLLSNPKIKHGKVMFAFCPNEDVGRAADGINTEFFNPDMLFDLDGPGGEVVTVSNFTARGFNVKFNGHDAHPGNAKAGKLGDATAAAATFIASVPVENRPENTEGRQGYIHPWSFEKSGSDVVVQTRIRYFDKEEGEKFDSIINTALARIDRDFPNVTYDVIYDGLQYENVAYTLHPESSEIVRKAAAKIGKNIRFTDERGGTTASMFAAKGLNGGMCVFTGQHSIHSTSEYADINEMFDAYRLMINVINGVVALNK